MKTKEELNALKEEVETVNKKLAELTEEELAQVSGGNEEDKKYICRTCGLPFSSQDALAEHAMRQHLRPKPLP